jgi:HlyD family secretion protein/epimerase transport system membrane fusion protein
MLLLRTNPRGAIVVGILLVLATLGGLGAWAALAPLASAVVASGVVVVENNRQDVQHLDGGIIAAILVREGTVVRADDVLLRLDPTRAQATLSIIQLQIDAARVLQARLLAEQRGASAITLSPEIVERQSTPYITDLIEGQDSIFQARRATLAGQTKILGQRILQFEQQIEGVQAQELSRTRQIALIHDELAGVRVLSERGLATRARLLALERELARLQGERGEHLAALARTQQAIGEAELQILQSMIGFREEVSKGLQDVQNQILELQERLAAATDVMRRLEIRAPTDGTVVGLTAHTVGGVIPPGRTVMQIVPALDTLIVEAQIPTTEVDGLTPGQSATIVFTALPQRTLPTLTGTLVHISADRLIDERTGVSYFKARVLIDPESFESLGARRIIPGMPAEVTITTGARTALRYLLDPVLSAFNYAMRER